MTKTRHALLHRPFDLRVEDVDLPELQPHQVLIRVRACGVCGSDVECYEGHSTEGRWDLGPYTPGHEWAGEILEIGESVLGFQIGDHVAAECVMACGVCPNCKSGFMPSACLNFREVGFRPDSPGGWSELVVIEEQYVHSFPKDWSFVEGAYVENFSIGYFGVWGNGGYIDASDVALISGCGPIGISALLVARESGAITIAVDVVEERRARALALGADHVLDPTSPTYQDDVMRLSNGGPDVLVECSGNDAAIASVFDVAGHNCRVSLVGHSIGRTIPTEIGKTIWKTLRIRGAGGTDHWMPRTIRFMDRLKRRHGFDFEDLVSHRYTLDTVHEALELASRDKIGAFKVMLTFDDAPAHQP